ncbi:MAG: aminopeptidase N, partial [Pseudomonadales bacterium]
MNATDQLAVTRLEDYRPPDYEICSTDLRFEIGDGETVVTNRMRLERRGSSDELVLDGQELELLSVSVDDRELGSNEYRLDSDSLTLIGLADECQVTVVKKIRPEQNTALEGLYKSSGMYCTQCEAEGFRKITYYQDRPDVLSVFTTTIIADSRYPVLLSNGNLTADERLDDGRNKVTWSDPFPKPSYLFALVAGDLALLEDTFVTASGRPVTLKIYSEPHNIDQCEYAMEALKRSMRWD